MCLIAPTYLSCSTNSLNRMDEWALAASGIVRCHTTMITVRPSRCSATGTGTSVGDAGRAITEETLLIS